MWHITTNRKELCQSMEFNSVFLHQLQQLTLSFVFFSGTPIQDIYNSDMQVGSGIICSIYSFQSFLSHVKV